jgi:hypothetical protein
MSNSDLIRKYFSAYENKDREVVESLSRLGTLVSNQGGAVYTQSQPKIPKWRLRTTTKGLD